SRRNSVDKLSKGTSVSVGVDQGLHEIMISPISGSLDRRGVGIAVTVIMFPLRITRLENSRINEPDAGGGGCGRRSASGRTRVLGARVVTCIARLWAFRSAAVIGR